MQTNIHRSLIGALTIVVCVAMAGTCIGCGSSPRMQVFNIDVDVRESVDRSFTVDLVGIRPADDHVKAISVDEYFDPQRQFRSDLFESSVPPVSHTFRAADRGVVRVMEQSHEQWNRWRDEDVMELMIIVDRLGARSATEYDVGGRDTRRLVIPLDHRRWDGKGDTITVDAQRTRLTYSPQPDALD